MKDQPSSPTCLNCGERISDRYCPRCGQEYGSTRVSLRSLYDEMVSLFIGDSLFSDKGALPRYGMVQTLWSIICRPAVAIGEFLAGRQRKYVSPLTLLLLVCTVCLLALTWSGFDLLDMEPADTQEADPTISALFGFMNNHIEVVALLNIPWMALACKWVFHRRSRLRYMEYFYIGLYLASPYIILTTGIVFFSHACGIDPHGTLHFLLTRTTTVMLYTYHVIVIRNILNISWTHSILGCLASQVITLVLTFMAVLLSTASWEIVFGNI